MKTKDKEKTLKIRKKSDSYARSSIRLITDSSSEAMKEGWWSGSSGGVLA
jgi:hypothetical protein